MRQLRMRVQHFLEGAKQAEVILAGLKITHHQDERPAQTELFLDRGRSRQTLDRMECRRDCVGHHHDFPFIERIMLKNRPARKLARREHACRRLHGTLYREAQLRGAKASKVSRMFQEADIVNAHHQRHGAEDRSGVLNMEQVGAMPAQAQWQVEPQPAIRIRRYAPGANAGRHLESRIRLGNESDELALRIEFRKLVEQIADVNLVPRQVTPDCVCVHRESHSQSSVYRLYSNLPKGHSLSCTKAVNPCQTS